MYGLIRAIARELTHFSLLQIWKGPLTPMAYRVTETAHLASGEQQSTF